ncbi:MAG: LacI family DNA-binding transcriptional regulator, partial [Christensenella sp.]
MATTIKDIAKSLNISEATVSLALNNNPLVNVKTKERVLVAAKKLKYFPNMMAKGLATNKSNTIGIIVPDINIVFYANILRAVDAIVGKAGYSLLAAMSNNDPEAEESIIQAFISKRIEGVLAVPTNKPTKFLTSYQKALKDYNIPLVYITSLYTIEGLKYVMGDIMQGTYMLVNHLIDLGHSNIVFIGGSRAVPTTALRIEGYTKAF